MSWIYNKVAFKDSMIPEGSIGFIYMMTAIIDGKCVRYIGKKNFYKSVKKKMGKKAIDELTDGRLKKYTRESKLDYKNYYSSNKDLKEAHKNNIVIHREILRICSTAAELTYQETKYQFVYEVLEKDDFLNANILGRFYKIK